MALQFLKILTGILTIWTFYNLHFLAMLISSMVEKLTRVEGLKITFRAIILAFNLCRRKSICEIDQ